jgi:hypothetical protein
MTDQATDNKLQVKHYKAISALLSEGSVRKASEACGTPERTLYLWFKQPDFADAYRAARREATQAAISLGQQYSGAMMRELLRLATAGRSEAVRLGAARTVLELAVKAVEIEDLAVRLEALEQRYAQSR